MHKKNKVNILIIGFGSIGQRHFRNIKKIFKGKINFFLLRKIYKTPILTKNNNVKKNQIVSTKSISYIKNLNDIKIKKINLQAAFICSPTSFHIEQLNWLIKNDINTFVEKPLSNNFKGLSKLKKINKKSSAITMIGYQMRFNPLINFLSNEENFFKFIGKLNFVEIKNGEDVRDFHPWEDYSKSYTSKKKLGGGVTLSQIHEFDYFNLIFKKYKIVECKSLILKTSNLKIDVDDTSSHLLHLRRKNENVICVINLNFYENPKTRTIKFVGDKGCLIANLNRNHITIFKKKKKIIKKFNFKKNDIFINELKYFFNCIKKKQKKHELDINHGINNLKFVLNLKKKN